MFQQQPGTRKAEDQGGRPKHRRSEKDTGAGEAQVEKATHRMLWSLDSRVRHIEGQTPSYFLVEGDTLLIPGLEGANRVYDSKIKRGTPHPDGPRRTSLAAAALNAIADADLTAAEGEVKDRLISMTRYYQQ